MISSCRCICVWPTVGLVALACSVLPAYGQTTTALFIDSELGDFVGQGVQDTLTPADLTFTATVSADRSLVTISARTANFSTFWDLTFAAPDGMPLAAGVYENASRDPFQAFVSPGLNVRSGRSCSNLIGRFQVHEIAVSAGGMLTQFAADFEQHCEGATPALFGAVRFNSTRSSLTPFDGAYPDYTLHLDSAVNGYVTGPGIDCGAGRTDCDEAYAANEFLTLEAVPLAGYVFLGWAGLDCLGDQTVAVTMTRPKFCTPVFNLAPAGVGSEAPDYSQGALFLDGIPGPEPPIAGGRIRQVFIERPAGSPTDSGIAVSLATTSEVQLTVEGPRDALWRLAFGAAPGDLLTPGSYFYAATSSFSRGQVPLLSVSGGGIFCSRGGRFELYEIAFANGVLTRFAADFELPCGQDGSLVSGSVRYRSTRASLLPFDGAYPLSALHIFPTVGGYVTSTGIDCGDGGRSDCDESYTGSRDVTIQAFPSPGYQFVGWSGSCSGAVSMTTIPVNRVKRCFAAFTPSAGSAAPPDPSLGTGTLLLDRPGSASPSGLLAFGGDSTVSPSSGSTGASVTFSFSSAGSSFPSVGFAVPIGRLAPGDYEEAYGSSFGSIFPSLSISSCNVTLGRFRIHEASFDGSGRLTAFAADFEAFCQSATHPYVVGAVRFNSTRAHLLPFDGAYPLFKLNIAPAVNGTVTGMGINCGPGNADCSEIYGSPTSVTLRATPAPGFRFVGWNGVCDGAATTTVAVNWIRRCEAVFNAAIPGTGPEDPRTKDAALFIDSQPGNPIGLGRRHVWLDAVPSASFTSNRSSARVSFRLPDGTSWTVELHAPASQELRPGTYPNAEYPFSFNRTMPGISVSSPAASCPSSTVTGRFVVYEVTFASSGELTALAADFEYRCAPGAPALFGSVRFNSSRSELRPFPPPPSTPGPNDFNVDGRIDFVWQNRADGRLAAWFMNGTLQMDNTAFTPDQVTDIAWHLVGGADANGDSHTDFYWQHQTTGALAIWYMYETTRIGTASLSPQAVADTQWKVRTVTDLDKNGSPDLIWQHTGSGHVAVWFMTGSHLRSGEPLGPGQVLDLNWKIVAAGDVDRDGNPDLFWHHAVTGQLAVWFMRGRVMASGQAISPDRVSDTAWHVRGAGDLDGNGSPDLIWQNTSTFQVAAWLLNGLQLIDGRVIAGPSLPNADWYVVSPK